MSVLWKIYQSAIKLSLQKTLHSCRVCVIFCIIHTQNPDFEDWSLWKEYTYLLTALSDISPTQPDGQAILLLLISLISQGISQITVHAFHIACIKCGVYSNLEGIGTAYFMARWSSWHPWFNCLIQRNGRTEILELFLKSVDSDQSLYGEFYAWSESRAKSSPDLCEFKSQIRQSKDKAPMTCNSFCIAPSRAIVCTDLGIFLWKRFNGIELKEDSEGPDRRVELRWPRRLYLPSFIIWTASTFSCTLFLPLFLPIYLHLSFVS